MRGVTQLPSDKIEEMVTRKHDLEFQLSLSREIMANRDILPFPIHRSVMLLAKAKRYQEALEICQYVEQWCLNAEADFDGKSAMVWRSPKLENCISRIPGLRKKLEN